MFCVSIGAWADATFSQIASGSNQVSNGKGFTFNHTTYAVTLENAGDLASYEYVTAGADAGADDVQYGTYFTFSGPMKAADLQALSTFASDANVTNDVYFDFSAATFVDDKGNTLTDASIISSMNNSKVKYIILPDNTTDISNTTFPSNVLEAEAINSTTGQFLGYSSANGDKTLEHVLAFDGRYAMTGNTITDYTLVGTYSYQTDSNGTPITYSTLPNYNSVFGLMKNIGKDGFSNASIKNLDLTNAAFPNYGTSKTYTSDLASWTGDANALELITEWSGTLESVSLPTTAETTLIPFHTFYNCKKLTSLEIPGNIKTLGMSAFEHCEEVTSITFNQGLTYMAPDAFYCCYKVTSIQLPVGLTDVGEYAFTNCYALDEIVIPEGVEVLGAGCFEYTNIKTIRLPNSLKRIEENAFRQCQKLKTITIPGNVEYIGSKAFVRCTHLTDVYFLGTTTIPEVGADVFGGDLYINNNACSRDLGTTGASSMRGNYDEALVTQSGNQYKVDYSCWATIENGEKVAGAAVLHYPVVNKEAGYAVTDYAASYAAYQTELDAYNTAVADKADEVAAYEAEYAKYQQDLEAYNSAVENQIYRKPYNDNPNWYEETTAQYIADHPSEDYYVLKSIGGYASIQAWQTNDGGTYPRGSYKYYTLKDGEYVEITDQVTDYNSANAYANGTGLYVYDSSVKVYEALSSEIKDILIQGEPTAPTPVEGVPTKPTAPIVYTKSGDSYVEYSGAPVEGVTYYVATAAVTDIYGEYYTIPARNASYGGVYNGGDSFEEKHNMGDVWPDIEDLYCWYANGTGTVADVGGRIGLPTPDDVNRDGLKNFLLVSGFPAESPISEVQEIDHIKKDVWYTMCFPFDLTDTQLQSCFGAGYEVAQFASVVENDSKTGYVLNFTTSVTPDANGVVTHKHVPYMIHPNSMAVNEDGTPKETVFTLTGITETQEDHDADQAMMMANSIAVEGYGGTFTFVGYGHNYQPSSVMIPRYSFFLGTKRGETYPKYWRQTGEDTRATGGYWNKNIAIVLPPSFEWSEVDGRAIYSDTEDGDSYVLLSTVRNEDSEKYKNYICEEYMYTPSSSAGAKALTNFEIMFTDDPIEDKESMGGTTAIKDVEEVVKSTVANGKVFSINGQYMGNSLENLPKGIYILNGKKYVIK